MFETKNDLSPTVREQNIGLLDARLADAVDLHTPVKYAHWNVKGPEFIALHKLFDEFKHLASVPDAAVNDRSRRVSMPAGLFAERVESANHQGCLS